MTFENEDEMLAYRRLCALMFEHPKVVEQMLAEAAEQGARRMRTNSTTKILFKRSARALETALRKVVIQEMLYWSGGK